MKGTLASCNAFDGVLTMDYVIDSAGQIEFTRQLLTAQTVISQTLTQVGTIALVVVLLSTNNIEYILEFI